MQVTANINLQHSQPKIAIKVKSLSNHPDLYHIVKDQFTKVIEPLYGSQRNTLDKIKAGIDRRTLVFFDDSKPVGILVYKRNPSDEFKDQGIVKSLEIKTLFVIDAENNSGKGYASRMMKNVHEYAMGDKGIRSIHVTVSETKSESLAFFKKQGFTQVSVMMGKYQKGINEILLAKNLIDTNTETQVQQEVKQKNNVAKHSREDDLVTSDHAKKARKEDVSKRTPTESSKSQRPEGFFFQSPRSTHKEVTLYQTYVKQIIDGVKTVEGRINSGMFQRNKIVKGDTFKFYSKINSVNCRVTDVIVYKSFDEMLQKEGYKNCVNEASSFEDAKAIYDKIPGYKVRAAQHGVVALRIKKN